MIISNIKLVNWRNFREADIKLGSRVFIAGPNASGKSNFLDVFRFLRDIAKSGGGLQKAVKDRGSLKKIRCLAARSNPKVEIEVTLSEEGKEKWRYALGIEQETRGNRELLVAYEKAWDEKNNLVLDRPDSDDKKDKARLTQTALEQINSNSQFREVAKFFDETLYLHLIPQLIRYPDAFIGVELSGDPFGKSFLERVSKTSEKVRTARLSKIEEALQLAVPQLSSLSFVKDDNGAPHLEALYKHWRDKSAKQREDQFSDGTLRLIGLLWSLLEGDTLLLLEEPELSLNGAIVEKLPALIYRLQAKAKKRRQIILTTHSVDLLGDPGIGGEEVLLLTPGAEGTTIERASWKYEIKDLLENGMSVGEAVKPLITPQRITQLALFE